MIPAPPSSSFQLRHFVCWCFLLFIIRSYKTASLPLRQSHQVSIDLGLWQNPGTQTHSYTVILFHSANTHTDISRTSSTCKPLLWSQPLAVFSFREFPLQHRPLFVKLFSNNTTQPTLYRHFNAFNFLISNGLLRSAKLIWCSGWLKITFLLKAIEKFCFRKTLTWIWALVPWWLRSLAPRAWSRWTEQ